MLKPNKERPLNKRLTKKPTNKESNKNRLSRQELPMSSKQRPRLRQLHSNRQMPVLRSGERKRKEPTKRK